MSPILLAPISAIRKLVSLFTLRQVKGRPSSLLKDPVLETVGAKGEKIWERMSFVVVLPTDPVRAISVKPGFRLRFSRFALARDERASTEFSTKI